MQRLGREAEYKAQALRERTQFFNREHWLSSPTLIRGGLRLLGLHEKARRNALAIEVRQHEVQLPHLPGTFDGFVLLHLADLHFGMNKQFLDALVRGIEPLRYDLCVLTGDYRAFTYGPYNEALDGLEFLRAAINTPAYAILGNRDTICAERARVDLTAAAVGYLAIAAWPRPSLRSKLAVAGGWSLWILFSFMAPAFGALCEAYSSKKVLWPAPSWRDIV